jgi:alkylation response protein AidB-like acyl-CoA dehydrogenase
MLTTAHTEGTATASALRDFFARTPFSRGDAAQTGRMLLALIDARLDRPPLPGSGDTRARWQALGAVAGFDLSLVKLYEGHTDAVAILAELDGAQPEAGTSWGVWAAEPPNARLLTIRDGDALRLRGTKAWCSGAASVTHALVTAWNERDESVLVAVDMRQPGVRVTDSGWTAVGMRASASVDVHFDDVPAQRIGAPRAYLERPGFWQGGAGIAACWHGAAASIASFVVRNVRDARSSNRPADPYKLAHLGAIDTTLSASAALLREAAAQIDRAPHADAMLLAMRTRLAAERAAMRVIEHAGRALGAGPLCRDEHFAHLMADLPVFIRQSHAERDEASLAQRVIDGIEKEESISWQL